MCWSYVSLCCEGASVFAKVVEKPLNDMKRMRDHPRHASITGSADRMALGLEGRPAVDLRRLRHQPHPNHDREAIVKLGRASPTSAAAKSPSHSLSHLSDPGFRAVDRQLFSCRFIDISARVRQGDTCSPRTSPAQDFAALSGSMILEQMAGLDWNRQQPPRPSYVVLVIMNVNEYVPSQVLRNIISAST